MEHSSWLSLRMIRSGSAPSSSGRFARKRLDANAAFLLSGRLAEFTSNLAKQDTELRRKLQEDLETEYQAKRTKLDEDSVKKQEALDADKKAALDAISVREEALRSRMAAFDLREEKGVRRELLERIEKVLKDAETLKLSEATNRKRWWIHGFTWLLLFVAILGSAISTYNFIASQSHDWILLLPTFAGSVTFVATLIYYLKWNDRWFREHAEHELAARRYKADILRASWIAELVLESNKSVPKNEIPTVLLEAFSKYMFTGLVSAQASEHPFDNISSLIKNASEINIGKGTLQLRADSTRK